MCDQCLCHKQYCIWPAEGAHQKSCDLCSLWKVVCTVLGGVQVCNQKTRGTTGKGKQLHKSVRVEESEAETEVSGVGPNGPSTLREEDKQTELLMGFKEGFDWNNELLVELEESSD